MPLIFFWNVKKNVIWPLEICSDLLKDQGNISLVTFIDRDTSLMNYVAKMLQKM